MDNSDWVEFIEGPVEQNTDRIYVSVNRRGNFYLNGKALKALDEPDAVVLMYDPRLQRIGVKRAPIARRNAFRLKRKDGDRVGGRVLYAANFCRHHNIRPKETLVFVDPKIDKDGLLILSLHDVGSGRR